MLSHLKEWILAGVGKRAPRRRGSVPRFRGQIEQLESRTVLSATIGVVAVDVVAVAYETHTVTVIAVLESRPIVPPRLVFNTFHQFGDTAWENLPSHGSVNDAWRPFVLDGRNDFQPPIALSGGGRAYGSGPERGTTEFSETGPIGTAGPTVYKPPQFAHADPSADPGVATGATSNFFPPLDHVIGPIALMNHLPHDATGSVASYFSSLSTLNSASEPASTQYQLSRYTYDAAFGEYSPNLLLLAADVDLQHGTDSDDALGDKLDSDNESSDELGGSEESLDDDDVAASLDALQRERSAIDAVLAELHEVKLRTDTRTPDASSTAEQQNSGAITESNGREHWANERVNPAQPFDQAEGGMVLLEPSGDANSSAYDLTATYLSGLDGSDGVPIGVEASVGMFQAIDIGANDLRPTSRENLPIAQPAATIRPSVSAENALAKKSEQPAA